jgi:hypothetical protein
VGANSPSRQGKKIFFTIKTKKQPKKEKFFFLIP